MAWDLPGLISAATDRAAAYFNKYKSCFDVLSLHTHAGTDGDGAALEEQYALVTHAVISLQPNGDFQHQLSDFCLWESTRYNNSAAINNTGTWKIGASLSDYTLTIFYRKSTDGGIADIYWNNVLVGQIDTYNGSTTVDNIETIDGVLGISGVNEFKVIVASKNGSSSAYKFGFSCVQVSLAGE